MEKNYVEIINYLSEINNNLASRTSFWQSLVSTFLGALLGFVSGYILFLLTQRRSKQNKLILKIRSLLQMLIINIRAKNDIEIAFQKCLKSLDNFKVQSELYFKEDIREELENQMNYILNMYTNFGKNEGEANYDLEELEKFRNYWDKKFKERSLKIKFKKIIGFFILKNDYYNI